MTHSPTLAVAHRRDRPSATLRDAPSVEVHSGFAAAIDEAAERADPRHRFLRRAWYAAAAGEQGATTIVARRPDGRVIAALPTVVAGPGWLGARTIPGSYWPYRSFPISDCASDDELAALLTDARSRRALGPVWRIGPVYDDDPTARRLLRVAPRGGWTIVRRRIGRSFLLDLPAARRDGAWPRASMLRKNRRHETRLGALGALEWRFVRGREWDRSVFEALREIEARSWVAKTDRSGAKFLSDAQIGLWRAVADDPMLAEMLSAALLYVGGEPAAFSFDLDIDHRQYGIASSYDERFARFGPGKLVTSRHLERSEASGAELIDWGAGDGGYKQEMGAVAGPEILDHLVIRSPLLAALLRPFWTRSRA